jgi:hypothetical protein
MGGSGSISFNSTYSKFFGTNLGTQGSVSSFYSTVFPVKKVHLDASTLSGSSGTQISTWTGSDSQPNATGASGTGSTKPTLQVISGRNYVSFNSSTQQHFTLPSITMTFRDGSNNPINGLTVFLVARRSTTTGFWERYVDFGNGAGVDNLIIARPNNNANTIASEYLNGGTYIISRNITANDGTFYVYAFVLTNGSTTSYRFYLNGSQVTSTSQNGGTFESINNRTTTINYVGRSNWSNDAYLNSDMGELIIINSALSNGQVGIWSTFLKTKWGIA